MRKYDYDVHHGYDVFNMSSTINMSNINLYNQLKTQDKRFKKEIFIAVVHKMHINVIATTEGTLFPLTEAKE